MAEFAIDSLRQLATKFLEIGELSNYNFQKEFLKPFQVIMVTSNPERTSIKEFIVSCMCGILMKNASTIMSGWSIILMIFKQASNEQNKTMVQTAMIGIEKIIKNDFGQIESNIIEVVSCLQ